MKVSRFGATVIGAREILIAYNVNIDEQDARVANPLEVWCVLADDS